MENYIVGTCSLSMTLYTYRSLKTLLPFKLAVVVKVKHLQGALDAAHTIYLTITSLKQWLRATLWPRFFLVSPKSHDILSLNKIHSKSLNMLPLNDALPQVFPRENNKLPNLIVKYFRDCSAFFPLAKLPDQSALLCERALNEGGLSVFVSNPSGIYAWLLIRHEVWVLNVDKT